MRHHNFAAILFTAALLSSSVAAIENADAKKVGPKASGYAIEQCLLANDAQTAENDTKVCLLFARSRHLRGLPQAAKRWCKLRV